MLISKSQFKTLLTYGLPVVDHDPVQACNLYIKEINKYDTHTFEALKDDRSEVSLRIFLRGNEVLRLQFTRDLCLFKAKVQTSELLKYSDELYTLMIVMIAYENSRSLKTHGHTYGNVSDAIKSNFSKNKKYEWN